jgi:hypothetical protein
MWADNINRFLEGRMRWYGMNSCVSGQAPVEDSLEHGNIPSGSIQFCSCVAAQLASSQEGLSFMKLVSLLVSLF